MGTEIDELVSSLAPLIAVSPDPMLIADGADGRILTANELCESMLGYGAGELCGLSVEALMPAPVRTRHRDHRSGYVRAPHIRPMGSNLELRALHRNGTELPVSVSLGPLDGDGVTAVLVALRDLSAHHRSERKFRDLLEAAPDGMVIVDETGTIVLVNAQAEEMFGYARAEMLDQPVEMLIPMRFRSGHHALRNGYRTAPRARPMASMRDLFGCRKDGTEFPVEISLSPLVTDDGRLFSAAVRDVTERKQTEREADRLKDEFLSLLSHELRTPLTSILGYTELLLDADGESLSEQSRHWVEVIEGNARREYRLVRDLLLLVQVEAGSFEIRDGPADIGLIAGEAVASARPMAERAGVALELVADPVEPIRGDAHRLGQVVDNLLTNAIKFTPTGGSVTVRVRAGDCTTVLEVTDTGVGIDPSEIDRLFDRLFRSAAASDSQIAGIGLGLTIVKAIVEGHDGTVSVTSEVGHGSTFVIELPCHRLNGVGVDSSLRIGAAASG